jgi:hypothetical protein
MFCLLFFDTKTVYICHFIGKFCCTVETLYSLDTVCGVSRVQVWRTYNGVHADSGCPLSVGGRWSEEELSVLDELCDVCSWRRPLLAWFSQGFSHVSHRREYIAKQFDSVLLSKDSGSRYCDLNWMWSVEEDRQIFKNWSPLSPSALAKESDFLNEISVRVASLPASRFGSDFSLSQEGSSTLWCLRRGIDPGVLVEHGLASENGVKAVVESILELTQSWTDSMSLVLSSSPGLVKGDLPYLLMCAGVLPHNQGGVHWSVIPSPVAQVLASGWPGVIVSVAGVVSLDEPLSSIGPIAASLWSSKSGPLSDAATALSAARTVCR